MRPPPRAARAGRVQENAFLRALESDAPDAGNLCRRGIDEAETEIVDDLAATLARWLPNHVDSSAIDAHQQIPPEAVAAAGDLGLFGLTLPEQYGGSGLSMKAACATIDQIAYRDCSFAVTIGLHAGLGTQALVGVGSEELRRRYLPPLASGGTIAALAATETGAGSDLSGIETTASRLPDGCYRLRGEKAYVTNGGIAGVFTVVAKTPALPGKVGRHSLFLIESGASGLRVGAEEKKLGLRGSSTTPLYLEEVRVPGSNLIGEAGEGLKYLNEILAWGRMLLSAGCLGTARAAYGKALRHVCARRQFGRPIGEFGQVREKIARMRATLFGMESLLRQTAQLHRSRVPDISWESHVVKVFCTEAAWSVIDDAVQLHGGSGVIAGTGIAQLLRDCRVARIFEGANEVLRFQLAAKSTLFPFDAGRVEKGLRSRVSARIEREAAVFDSLHSRLGAAIEQLLVELGSGLFSRQLLLKHISEAGICLYALLAVIRRTDAGLGRRDGKEHLELTRYLTLVLGRRVEQGLEGLTRGEDEALVGDISNTAFDAVRRMRA